LQTEDKLLPCPFCGGNAEYIEDDGNHHYAECKDCGTSRGGFAYTPTEFRTLGIEGIRERTSEAWNTRAAPKVKALEWHLNDIIVKYQANTGFYRVKHRVDQTFELTKRYECLGAFRTLSEAKAAAQSHYEKQILEALE
jgi:hypothetical protein